MKCKACDVGTVNWDEKRGEFDILCKACRLKGDKAVALDGYDLEGYWSDNNWSELGGQPFTRFREDVEFDPDYMTSGNIRAAPLPGSDGDDHL